MKTKNRKKNDRVAFFTLSKDRYFSMNKSDRNTYRKPERLIGSLEQLILK